MQKKKKGTIKNNPAHLNWDAVGITNSRFIKKYAKITIL